jgi:hypothetical protein
VLHFYKKHAGQTVLLVGNGVNLSQTPPQWFRYPSFGMNTIHKYEGWTPTYYTAVDSRVEREFGNEIKEKYKDIPKFIPTPNLDHWTGENFYRFYHRPGPLYPMNGKPMLYDRLMLDGISYGNIMHVAMQLAAWMGFTTLLIIGMQHKAMKAQEHFWGCDHGMSATPPVQQWLDGYKEIVGHMHENGIRVINIGENTFVPDNIIPRGDWREWRNDESKNA